MAGVSDWPFRRLAMDEGAALTYSEMASAASLAHRGKGTLRLLKNPQGGVPFAIQLFGKDPALMAEAARVAEREHGAALIDLNLACPARKVVRSGHGAALLENPRLCCEITERAARAVGVPVTVKCRPGLRPPEGGGEAPILPLATSLESAGAMAIALHPRYASQGYHGEADWSLVTALAGRVGVPVIGSGDIASPGTALRRLRESGASLVMLGRATRGRPWLFAQCLEELRHGRHSPKDPSERLPYALRHARLLYEEIGPRAVYPLRSVLAWYLKGLPGAASYRDRICHEEDFQGQLAIVAEAHLRAGEGGPAPGAPGGP
jgi:tRNA-dihydrouridine synthase B